MTDSGYVAGGYGVTVVAIGAYIAHMWARNRTLTRLNGIRPDEVPAAETDDSRHEAP